MALVSNSLQPGEYVALCMKCQPLDALKFETAEKRDDWSARHRTTGHEVIDVDGPKVQ